MILKPHHQMAVSHLMTHDDAALFAGMGLGKTACTLLSFDGLRMLGLAKRALIVAPLRVSVLTWPNEIEKWAETRHLKFALLRNRAGMDALRSESADVYLINYERLPKLGEYLQTLPQSPFDTVIFDELTNAKNPGAKRINRFRKQITSDRGVSRRWGLTGTPTPNSLMEVYAQIRLLDGGKRFGPSFGAFQQRFFEPTDYMQYNWVPRKGAEETIRAILSDIALSLPAEKYVDYPLPTVEDVAVALPEEAREVYDQLSKSLLAILEDESEVVALTAGALLQKLLQVTGGAVYREDQTVAIIHDAKLSKLAELIDKTAGPVLVGCNYIHERDRILKRISGAVEFENTQEFLARWNAGKIPVIVAHPKSLGHGLNMQHGGREVIWYSLPFSSELYDQFNARLVRSGQKEQVRIRRILSPDTADDAVVEALRQKDVGQRSLMNALHNFKRLAS